MQSVKFIRLLAGAATLSSLALLTVGCGEKSMPAVMAAKSAILAASFPNPCVTFSVYPTKGQQFKPGDYIQFNWSADPFCAYYPGNGIQCYFSSDKGLSSTAMSSLAVSADLGSFSWQIPPFYDVKGAPKSSSSTGCCVTVVEYANPSNVLFTSDYFTVKHSIKLVVPPNDQMRLVNVVKFRSLNGTTWTDVPATNSKITYSGTFTKSTCNQTIAYKQSSLTGASALYYFVGTRVQWYGLLNANSTYVYVDGQLVSATWLGYGTCGELLFDKAGLAK